MNKISRELIQVAKQIKKEQVLEEIDQYNKQLIDVWSEKNVIADFIVSAFLQQNITDSMFGHVLSTIKANAQFGYKGLDELSQKTFKSYSQIYAKIMHSISKQTIQKMKKIDKKKLIQLVSKKLTSNVGLASMRNSLFNETTKFGKQLILLKKKVEKQGISVQQQNDDQFNFQINQI